MRRIYCCLIWGALVFVLTACGNNQHSKTEPVKEKKAAVETPMDHEPMPLADQAEQTPPPVQDAVPPADQAPSAEQQAAPHN